MEKSPARVSSGNASCDTHNSVAEEYVLRTRFINSYIFIVARASEVRHEHESLGLHFTNKMHIVVVSFVQMCV